ncbi:hypothetical protein ElyMa_003530800, partial [Elysia marginata]
LRKRVPPQAEETTKLPNAVKCQLYKDRLKEDPQRWEGYLARNKMQAHRWRASQSEKQRQHTRELASEILKAEAVKTVTPQRSSTPKKTVSKRQDNAKLAEKRQKDRERQAKRRAKIKANLQKYS